MNMEKNIEIKWRNEKKKIFLKFRNLWLSYKMLCMWLSSGGTEHSLFFFFFFFCIIFNLLRLLYVYSDRKLE